VNAEELEVAPGFEHENLQGRVWERPPKTSCAKGWRKRSIIGRCHHHAQGPEHGGGLHLRPARGCNVERFGRAAFSKGRSDEDFHSLFRHRDFELYRTRYRGGKELGSVAEEYWEKKAAGETNIELTPEKLD